MKLKTYLYAALTVLTACGGGSGGENPGMAGPCVVNFQDPVFVIADVRSSLGTLQIGLFTVDQIYLGGIMYLPQFSPAVLRNAVLIGDAVACTTNCGFATAEGTYVFNVSSTGFTTKKVTVDAKYASFQEGCPASYSGPTVVSITLDPSS